MTLDLEAARESIDGLNKVAATFERKGMPAGAHANRVLAQQTQALVDEVTALRHILSDVRDEVRGLMDSLDDNVSPEQMHGALSDNLWSLVKDARS